MATPSTIVCLRAKITVTGKAACVDQEPIVLNAPAGEQAEWYNPEPYPVRIQFAISPFDKNSYDVPAKGHVSSGPIRADAKHCKVPTCPEPYATGHQGNSANGHYKYSILKSPNGPVLVDPEVVIKP